MTYKFVVSYWAHSKGNFYHDGRFATLMDVIYYDYKKLNLSETEKNDLTEFLKSL